jgi:23S rRNA (pseudouridine1915-N3)-methyltransferase
MKVNLITIGKLKDEYFKKAFAEYEKRLSRFCVFTVSELPEARFPDNPKDAEIETALKKEAVLINKALTRDALTIAFCIEGRKVSSEQFSGVVNCGKNVNFIIGSTHGLDVSIKQNAECISFSDMTFPHGLFRVMAAEQIYRALQIEAGGAYHSAFTKKVEK